MFNSTTINEPFLSVQNNLGEGCVWDPETGLLHWVDIFKSQIHTVDPKTKKHSVDDYSSSDPVISSLVLLKDGSGFIGSHKTHLAHFPPATTPTAPFPNGTTTQCQSTPLSGEKAFEIPQKYLQDKEKGTHRFNDGAADAKGRFWIGTMGHDEHNQQGQFYRYDPDGTVETFYEDIGCSNGIGFSPDNKLMYYIDSPTKLLYVLDFDLEKGKVSNRRTLIDSTPFDNQGTYDGLCMDSEGAIWAARWGNNRVVRILPSGEVEREIVIPGARNITCCIFGGEDMQDLFITSAHNLDAPELDEKYPQRGDLFKVRIEGIKGVERFRFGQ